MEQINRSKNVLTKQRSTRKWLAKTLRKNEATISRWYTNELQPFFETLLEIAKVLKEDVCDLLIPTKLHPKFLFG